MHSYAKVPKLIGVPFETAIIERYRRRECSIKEALIEMYLAGVSVRRVEDITEALWGNKVSPGTIAISAKKLMSILNRGYKRDGCREIIGAAERMKGDRESWRSFFVWFKERGLQGIRFIIGDKCPGMLETIPEVAAQVAATLSRMKLSSAAKKLKDGIDETLTYVELPSQHLSRIRTNNTMNG